MFLLLWEGKMTVIIQYISQNNFWWPPVYLSLGLLNVCITKCIVDEVMQFKSCVESHVELTSHSLFHIRNERMEYLNVFLKHGTLLPAARWRAALSYQNRRMCGRMCLPCIISSPDGEPLPSHVFLGHLCRCGWMDLSAGEEWLACLVTLSSRAKHRFNESVSGRGRRKQMHGHYQHHWTILPRTGEEEGGTRCLQLMFLSVLLKLPFNDEHFLMVISTEQKEMKNDLDPNDFFFFACNCLQTGFSIFKRC